MSTLEKKACPKPPRPKCPSPKHPCTKPPTFLAYIHGAVQRVTIFSAY